MEVSGQLHAPAASLSVKEPPVAIEQEAWWAPRAGLDAMKKRKISCLCRKSNPGSPACGPTMLYYPEKNFEIFTAVTVRIVVFWVVRGCSLVSEYRRFGATLCLHLQS
jgi:hypothetical protein